METTRLLSEDHATIYADPNAKAFELRAVIDDLAQTLALSELSESFIPPQYKAVIKQMMNGETWGARELHEATGYSETTIRSVIIKMMRHNAMHRPDWKPGPRGGIFPLYRLGPGENVTPPPPGYKGVTVAKTVSMAHMRPAVVRLGIWGL